MLKKRYTHKETLSKKTVLITGASKGIGNLLSQILSYKCDKVFMLARSLENSKEKNMYMYKCDCSNYDEVESTIDGIKNKHGVPDIIVNCAGLGDWKRLDDMNKNEIIDCVNAPFLSSVWICKKYLDYIKIDKTNNKYQIVFIQSPAVLQPWKRSTMYSASRWAMRGLSESLRLDYSRDKLQISEIILGKVNSSYFTNNPNCHKHFPKLAALIPSMTTLEASNIIIETLKNKSDYVVYPQVLRLFSFVQQYFPSLIRYIINTSGFMKE